MSPPQLESELKARSSPFGPLEEEANRRVYAYLIATLNAAHSDYDFSHVLRVTDFKREPDLPSVIARFDEVLRIVRPNSMTNFGSGDVGYDSFSHSYPKAANYTDFNTGVSASPAWNPDMWTLIDAEMVLKDCLVFSYNPSHNPFEEEIGATWALHYFFFNKNLKRVCYLYFRVLPVMSHSPTVSRLPRAFLAGGRLAGSGGGAGAGDYGYDDDGTIGAKKRANYWFGGSIAQRIKATDSDDDMYDDGFAWSRDIDGDVDGQFDDDYDEDEDDFFEELEELEDEDDVEEEDEVKRGRREVSEDMASRMEIDV